MRKESGALSAFLYLLSDTFCLRAKSDRGEKAGIFSGERGGKAGVDINRIRIII